MNKYNITEEISVKSENKEQGLFIAQIISELTGEKVEGIPKNKRYYRLGESDDWGYNNTSYLTTCLGLGIRVEFTFQEFKNFINKDLTYEIY